MVFGPWKAGNGSVCVETEVKLGLLRITVGG